MKTIIRLATLSDIDILVKVRFDYFASESWAVSPEQRKKIERSLRRYYANSLGADFIAAFAEAGDELAAVAFLAITELPANLSFPTGRKGTLLNVLTYPQYRKNGYAKRIITMLIDEAKGRDVSYIELSASEQGRPLYQSLGFAAAQKREHFTEMRLSIDDD